MPGPRWTYADQFDPVARNPLGFWYGIDRLPGWHSDVGLGVSFSSTPDTQFSAFFEYEEGQDAEEEPALEGLDEIDATVEGQLTLAHRFGNASVFGVLQPDLLGDAKKGLVRFVGAGYDRLINRKRLRLSTRIDVSGAEYYVNERFSVLSSLETEYYLGDTAKSPLIAGVGQRTTVEASASVALAVLTAGVM